MSTPATLITTPHSPLAKDRPASFLGLPPEVRRLVYCHVFGGRSVIPRWTDSSQPSQQQTTSTNVLLVSRLCYREAKSIFYQQSRFHLNSFTFGDQTCLQIRELFGLNAEHVHRVYYTGTDHRVVLQLQDLFPRLKTLELSLGKSFFPSDQTNFDRAMKYALRYGEGGFAIKKVLDERFDPGMRNTVAALQRLGPARGFRVKLHRGVLYRFLDFRGEIDLDEWILRIWDPDGKSTRIYEIPQDPLEPT